MGGFGSIAKSIAGDLLSIAKKKKKKEEEQKSLCQIYKMLI